MRRLTDLTRWIWAFAALVLIAAWPVWAGTEEASFPGVRETIFTIERPQPL